MINFSKSKRILLIITGLIAVLSLSLAFVSFRSGALEVHFLDVGQGDAVFIETPSGKQVLIDGGSDSSVLRELEKVMPFYDRSVDLVIASHLDKDHIGGLPYVLDNFKVGGVILSKKEFKTSTAKTFKEKIKSSKVALHKIRRGDVIHLGENTSMHALFPGRKNLKTFSENNASLVLKMSYRNDSFLFTGDIEKEAEVKLASRAGNLNADVLKVAHHGSKSSSMEYFLSKVKPKVAVIQVGKENRYGHPHNSVVRRIKNIGTKVLRNDKNGLISLYSYGDTF